MQTTTGINTGFVVTCEECNCALQEIDTLWNGGITLHILFCPLCGRGATLVTNTLCENGNEIFGDYAELHTPDYVPKKKRTH